MQEHMLVMSQLMRQMSPEQREQMMQDTGAVIRLKNGPGNEDIFVGPAPVPAP